MMKKLYLLLLLSVFTLSGSSIANPNIDVLNLNQPSFDLKNHSQNKTVLGEIIFDQGGFECNDGYYMDNTTGLCVDINECSNGMAPGCSVTQICSNTIGSFTCDDCITGHENNGIDNTCFDINECTTNTDNCSSPGGVCSNSDPALPLGSPSGIPFTCDCYPGYTSATCGTDAACTIFIDRDNITSFDGGTWATAYPEFDDLPPVIGSSCDIWVAEGIYSTNDTDPVLTMYDGVDVYGGFNATESDLSARDWNTNITTLHGDATAYHVVTMADDARLDGFVIQEGNATGAESDGAGVLFDNVSSSSLFNSTVSNNYATGNGGGVHIDSSTDITIDNTFFNFNFSDNNAGAISIVDSTNVILNKSILTANYAQNGGGVHDDNSTLSIINSVFIDNNATNSGESIYNAGADSMISHSSITNGTTNNGILIHNDSAVGFVQIDNSIIWNEQTTPLVPVSGVLSNVTINNSIIHDPTMVYPANNISSEPEFINWPNDLRLYSNSPAIDIAVAGNAIDINELPRTSNIFGGTGIYDAGAYEFQDSGVSRDPHIWHVDGTDVTAPFDGTSWQSAYDNLNDALDVAQAGDMIWVAGDGDTGVTYYPNNVVADNESTFILPTGVKLYGGFDNTDDSADLDTRDASTYITILSCDINLIGTFSDNCGHTLTLNNDVTVDGFAISDGNVRASATNTRGGSLFGENINNVILNDLTIKSSVTDGSGGGFYCNGCTNLSANNLRLFNNTSINGNGGGMMLDNSPSAVFTGILQSSNNTTSLDGGGMYIDNSPFTTIANLLLNSNDASNNGGGAYISSSDNLTVLELSIALNDAFGNGGGISIDSKNISISNGAVYNNSTLTGNGGGLWIGNSSDDLTITNVDIYNNHTEDNGGGLWIGSAQNVLIQGEYIGGVYKGSVYNNTVSNSAIGGIGDGVGIYISSGADVTIKRITIHDNHPLVQSTAFANLGGGLFTNGENVFMQNVLMYENKANGGSPAIHVGNLGYLSLDFVTVADHYHINGQLQLQPSIQTEGDLFVDNSIIWPDEQSQVADIGAVGSGSVFLTASDVYGANRFSIQACSYGSWTCVADLDENPVFINSSLHNYKLSTSFSYSPAINMANPGVNIDLDGISRPQDGEWDMGCYEVQ